MAAWFWSAASYAPIVDSWAKCPATASMTGRGGSAAPALLRWATFAQPGVSVLISSMSTSDPSLKMSYPRERVSPGGTTTARFDLNQS
ncbi:hypothetical protein LUW74_27135 [Actinomadura madurae]|uniref:hypothetical protein n=1 Tax=Actinomadura madurae TaxID=1993 RepID=UPI002025FE33|nr:hypothetical protein [Actinomadura madurae]URN10923.1 hypothetical protein LUW74_27135 [Actinomadura madurae]